MYLLAPLFNGGHEVDHQAEAAERAYALSDLERERAGFDFEELAAFPSPPDPAIYERDANEVYFDRYRGCFQ